MKEDVGEVQKTFNELRDVTKVLHEEVMFDDLDTNGTTDILNDEFVTTTEFSENKNSMKSNASYSGILKRSDQILSPKDIENQYKNKFRRRCLKQLDNGKTRCRKAFLNALEKCYKKMPFIIKTLICWPFKVDFICNINILGNPEKICEPTDAVAANFGETYSELIITENHLYEDSSSVNVNYTIMRPEEMPGVK